MDYGKAFTFVFDDQDWLKKIGMASVWSFLGFLLLIFPGIIYSTGYVYETANRVYQGQKEPLQDPNDFGTCFSSGLKLFIIGLVYLLPFFALMILQFVVFGGAAAVMETGAESAGAVIAGVGGLVVVLLYLALGLLYFFMLQIIPIVLLRSNGDLSAAFNVRDVFQLASENIGPILLIFCCALGAQFVSQVVLSISAITICIPLIIGIPLTIWAQLVSGHLWGQLAADLDRPKDSAAPLASA